jgi:hypothetical protein
MALLSTEALVTTMLQEALLDRPVRNRILLLIRELDHDQPKPRRRLFKNG